MPTEDIIINEYIALILLAIAIIEKKIDKKIIFLIYLGKRGLVNFSKFIEKIDNKNNNNAVNSNPKRITSVFIETPIVANSGVTKNAALPRSE